MPRDADAGGNGGMHGTGVDELAGFLWAVWGPGRAVERRAGLAGVLCNSDVDCCGQRNALAAEMSYKVQYPYGVDGIRTRPSQVKASLHFGFLPPPPPPPPHPRRAELGPSVRGGTRVGGACSSYA